MVTSQAVNYGGYKKANNATHETPNYLKKKAPRFSLPKPTVQFISIPVHLRDTCGTVQK